MVRSADDPLDALLEAVRVEVDAASVDAAADRLRDAVADAQGAARARHLLAEPADIANLVLIASLPIGLVTVTGWWTLVAVAAVGLMWFLVDDLAAQHEDPFGLGGVRADVPHLAVPSTPASKLEEAS